MRGAVTLGLVVRVGVLIREPALRGCSTLLLLAVLRTLLEYLVPCGASILDFLASVMREDLAGATAFLVVPILGAYACNLSPTILLRPLPPL